MQLKLYNILYEPMWPVPGGFAYVLAVDEVEAKAAWLEHHRTPMDGEQRFISIEEVDEAKFHNRSVLVNENGDY